MSVSKAPNTSSARAMIIPSLCHAPMETTTRVTNPMPSTSSGLDDPSPTPDVTVEALLVTICQVVCDEIAAAVANNTLPGPSGSASTPRLRPGPQPVSTAVLLQYKPQFCRTFTATGTLATLPSATAHLRSRTYQDGGRHIIADTEHMHTLTTVCIRREAHPGGRSHGHYKETHALCGTHYASIETPPRWTGTALLSNPN